MALSDDILDLRDRVLGDLATAHDYYTDTRIVWDITRRSIMQGRTVFTIRNKTTGTLTTQADVVLKARGYVAGQLAEATFQQFISIFENFFLDLLRLWLTAHPRSLGKKTMEFRTILDLADKDAITDHFVRKELNEVLYARPTEWFAYLEGKAQLGCPAAHEVDRIAEAKASRDILVHNAGVANKTYESKAGPLARFHEGQRIDIPEHYHRETWELIRKVITDVSDAAIAKAP